MSTWVCGPPTLARTRYVPDAIVYHKGSATANRMNYTKTRLIFRNSLFLFFQYMPPRVILKWGIPMMGWPFVYALLKRVPLRHAAAAIGGLARSAPDVLRRRRQVRGGAAIDDSTFRRFLSPPVGPADFPRPGPGIGEE